MTAAPGRRWGATPPAVACVVASVFLTGAPAPAAAQSSLGPAAAPSSTGTPPYESATAVVGTRPPLDTIFAITLHAVSVHAALDAITRRSGIPLNFDAALVDSLPQHVTIDRARTTVACALAVALKGTGLAAEATAWDRIVLTVETDATLHPLTCRPRH